MFRLFTSLLLVSTAAAAENTFRGTIETMNADARFDTANRHFFAAVHRWQQAPTTAIGIHQLSVDEFTRHPGFGIGRGGPIYPESPKHWTELVRESEGTRIHDFGKAKDQPKYDAIKETLTYTDGQTEGVKERVWLVKSGQLMSTGETIEAYDQATTPNMHEIMSAKKAPKKRKATAFETLAVAELKKGRDLAISVEENTMLVVGAVRAGKSCVDCHKVEENTLLGAFTYTLDLQDESLPAKERLANLKGLSPAEREAVKLIESRGGKVTRDGDGPVTAVHLGFARTGENSKGFAGYNTRISARDSGVSTLAAFENLKTVDVSYSMISDAGLDAIAKLPRVESINTEWSAVTAAGVEKVKKEKPNLTVKVTPKPQPVPAPTK